MEAMIPAKEQLSACLYTVSQVAAATGVNASAVRFYEKHGVVVATRTQTNQRRFDGSSICRIQVAKLAQRVGLTVKEIASLFEGLSPDPGPANWEVIATQLVEEAESRLERLKKELASLSTGAKLCEIGAASG